MELKEFIQQEMMELGSRHQRWPIRFQCSYYRMVAHLYEPLPDGAREQLSQKTILKPFSFDHGVPLKYVPRDHWVEKFKVLFSKDNLKDLGHPNFQLNFCDIKGAVRNQVFIWNCDIRLDELTCVKLLRVKNRSLLTEFNYEFHLLLKTS